MQPLGQHVLWAQVAQQKLSLGFQMKLRQLKAVTGHFSRQPRMLSASQASWGTRYRTNPSLCCFGQMAGEGMGGKDELLHWLSSLHRCSWGGDTNWYVSYFPKDSLLRRGVNEVGNIYKMARSSAAEHQYAPTEI